MPGFVLYFKWCVSVFFAIANTGTSPMGSWESMMDVSDLDTEYGFVSFLYKRSGLTLQRCE